MNIIEKCLLILAIALTLGCIQVFAQETDLREGWVSINTCKTTFMIPGTFKRQNRKGKDSCVARFEDGTRILALDYGWFNGPPRQDPPLLRDHKEEEIFIDGLKGVFVTYMRPTAEEHQKLFARMWVRIYPSHPDRPDSLNIYLQTSDPKDFDMAKRIFQSVRLLEK